MHVDGWDVLMSWLCDEYLHIHICKNFQKWFMLVCLCHCCVYMYVICILMFLQAYGSQSWSWISSFSPHLIFLKHYFSLNLELTDSSRLVVSLLLRLSSYLSVSAFSGIKQSCWSIIIRVVVIWNKVQASETPLCSLFLPLIETLKFSECHSKVYFGLLESSKSVWLTPRWPRITIF